MDAVLLINEPTFTGCVTVTMPVANIKMIDGKERDDKVVAVSTTDPFYKHIKDLEDLPRSMIDELTYFYNNYKRAEKLVTDGLKREYAEDAKKIITWAQGMYRDHEEDRPSIS